MREEELTLEKLLAKARSLEASEIQATGMEESLSHQCQVNFVRDKKPKPQQRPTTPLRTSQSLQTCRKCGQSWPHKGRPCPAQGQTCHKCGKPNHYARVCMSATRLAQNSSQQINQVVEKQRVEESSDSDDEYVYSIGKDKSHIPKATVQINDVDVSLIIDTGASVDVIDEHTFNNLVRRSSAKLSLTAKCLFAYGSNDQLLSLGQFDGTITFQQKKLQRVPIHVLQGNHGSLLSYKTALALGILKLHVNQVKEGSRSVDSLEQRFPNLFTGIGQLTGDQVQLHIDTTVEPVAQKARRIPFHIRKKVEKELSNLE